jgi:DNA-binding GntR family transcriptional regulator
MLELYDVRAALEEFAARQATPRLRDDVSALQAEVDGMADAAAREDVRGVVEHSERFHRLIVEASGNKLLETMWSSLSITDHTELTMVTLPLDMTTVAVSHQPIVDAIAAGDVELACRVSREHQEWFVDELNATAEQRAAQQTQAAPAELTT